MFIQAVFLFLLVLHGSHAATRIIGGKDAQEGQFPYMVSLRNYNEHFCGGSIINEKYVLTAAHCEVWGTIRGLTAVAGTTKLDSGGAIHIVKSFNIHSGWNSTTLENDIAVIEVETPFVFDEFVRPIKLPENDTPVGTWATASGWGKIMWPPGGEPNVLQWLELKTLDQPSCRRMHLPNNLEDSQLCTLMEEDFGICSGDSGGPLMHEGRLVGIASAAYLCAQAMPDIFTRVYSFLDWIEVNTP